MENTKDGHRSNKIIIIIIIIIIIKERKEKKRGIMKSKMPVF
jgi:hypothetical protein